MAEPPIMVEIRKDQLDELRRRAGANDQFDAGLSLEEFRKGFLDESDAELERKRKIMRNRVLAGLGGQHQTRRSSTF